MRLSVCLLSFSFVAAVGAIAHGQPVQNQSAAATEQAAPAQAEGATAGSLDAAFDSGTLDGKLEALKKSANLSPNDRSALALKAIDYVLANYAKIRDDSAGQELALSAAQLVGTTSAESAPALLWQLFNADSRPEVREATLAALAKSAVGRTDVIAKMNLWLATQDNLFASGSEVDLPVVAACAHALGTLSDPSSFPVLFSASLLHYPKPIDGSIEGAIDSFKGNLPDLLVSVILNNPLPDKQAALAFAIANKSLAAGGKGEVAMAALKLALAGPASSADERAVVALRFAAVDELKSLAWAPATGLLIENFDQALSQYDRGTLAADQLVVSIAALGSMGTHEAAVRLSLYLDLIGTYVQSGQSVSVPVVLAVISSLAQLRDPIAIENLLSVQYLGYPAAVKQAARQAVENLQAGGVES